MDLCVIYNQYNHRKLIWLRLFFTILVFFCHFFSRPSALSTFCPNGLDHVYILRVIRTYCVPTRKALRKAQWWTWCQASPWEWNCMIDPSQFTCCPRKLISCNLGSNWMAATDIQSSEYQPEVRSAHGQDCVHSLYGWLGEKCLGSLKLLMLIWWFDKSLGNKAGCLLGI